MVKHLLTNKNISETLNVIVLLMLLTPITIYALTITIDGNENDWMPNDWTYPGGTGCNITEMSNYTVWLCCDRYPNPTKCQLMWRDKRGDEPNVIDVIYARLYMNSSGLYLYIVNAHAFQNQQVVANFCGQITTIAVNNPPPNVICTTTSRTDGYALEMKIPLTVTQVNTCVFGAGLLQGNNLKNIKITIATRTITTVNLIVSGGYIVGGSYDSIPIPVPEPWYISLAVLVSTSLVLLFFVKKVKI